MSTVVSHIIVIQEAAVKELKGPACSEQAVHLVERRFARAHLALQYLIITEMVSKV